MLVPDLRDRITILDKKNKVVPHFGGDEDWRAKAIDKSVDLRTKRHLWEPGKIVHPHDACFYCDGNISVAEWVVTDRVSKRVKVG